MRNRVFPLMMCVLTTSTLNAQVIRNHTLITPPDGMPDQTFGRSVVAAGDYVAISAPGMFSTDAPPGAVYIYQISTNTIIHTLQPNELTTNDNFGSMISMSDETLVVATDTDAVYVYDIPTGDLSYTLYPPDNTYFSFGNAVHVQDEHIAISSTVDNNPGTRHVVHLYDRSTGTHVREIQPTPPATFAQLPIVRFHDDQVIVGPVNPNTTGSDGYVIQRFRMSDGAQQAQYDPTGLSKVRQYGNSFEIAGPTLVSASRMDSDYDRNLVRWGSLFFHDYTSSETIQRTLLDSQDADQWILDSPLAVDENLAIIKANLGTYGNALIHQYEFQVFDIGNTEFTDRFWLLNPPATIGSESFAQTYGGLELTQSLLLIGDREIIDPTTGHNTGGVVIVNLNDISCLADYETDGTLNAHDVIEFVNKFTNSHMEADINLDGMLNFFDVAVFVESYLQGCNE